MGDNHIEKIIKVVKNSPKYGTTFMKLDLADLLELYARNPLNAIACSPPFVEITEVLVTFSET